MEDGLKILAAEIGIVTNKEFDHGYMKMIESLAVGYRATLLKQEFDKNGKFPSGDQFTVTLPVISVPSVECLSEEVHCEVMRTVNKVPSPIRTNISSIPFRFVGTSNQSISYSFIWPEDYDLIVGGTRFVNRDSYYTYIDGYVYLFGFDEGRITIRDPFDDPRKLKELKDCDGNSCYEGLDLSLDMKKTIKMMIFEELRLFVKPLDKEVRVNEQESQST